jgi:hypothetical protein
MTYTLRADNRTNDSLSDDGRPLPQTVVTVVGTIMVTPSYFFATYTFSGASRAKGMTLAAIALFLGSFMPGIFPPQALP